MKIHDRLSIKRIDKKNQMLFLNLQKKELNFLSHYYFVQSINNPYYTLGAILPDLFRNHHYDWKFRPEKENLLFKDNSDLQLLFRSEEHTSELQSLLRISYAVFCLKKKIISHLKLHILNRL